jgi:hypothetical protein
VNTRLRASALAATLCAASLAADTRPAAAWETTTHVGLAEQAGLAAGLDGTLRRLGWRGGLFEPLVIPPEDAPAMMASLALHSAADGYVPDTRGQQYALGWLLAGAALADATTAWAANHFLDPFAGGAGWRGPDRGLDDRFGPRVAGAGRVPARGVPADVWVTAAENPLGLAGFLDQYAKSLTAATPGERGRAMAGALVAAGAMMHVLGDMSSPTHVRGSAADQLAIVDVATGERGARLDRLAAIAFGRLGVPAAREVVMSRTLAGFFRSAADDGGGVQPREPGALAPGAPEGLATWTARHFFTPSTLPRPVPAGRLPRERLATALTRALRRPAPVVPARLSLLTAGQPEGATLRDERQVCLAQYRVERGMLSWSLDDDCLLEQAQALLPVAAGYQAGLLRWLFRGELTLEQGEDGKLSARTRGLALGAGDLAFVVEDGRGVRRTVASAAVPGAADETELGEAAVPAGARRALAVYRGVDVSGEPVIAVGVLERVRSAP